MVVHCDFPADIFDADLCCHLATQVLSWDSVLGLLEFATSESCLNVHSLRCPKMVRRSLCRFVAPPPALTFALPSLPSLLSCVAFGLSLLASLTRSPQLSACSQTSATPFRSSTTQHSRTRAHTRAHAHAHANANARARTHRTHAFARAKARSCTPSPPLPALVSLSHSDRPTPAHRPSPRRLRDPHPPAPSSCNCPCPPSRSRSAAGAPPRQSPPTWASQVPQAFPLRPACSRSAGPATESLGLTAPLPPTQPVPPLHPPLPCFLAARPPMPPCRPAPITSHAPCAASR